jgi:predicted AAA+ superfamily ATPase
MGGFPLAIKVDFSKTLLKDYFLDIVERDVKRHVAAHSTRMLLQVAKAIFESTGSELSLRNLARAFDTTADTVKTYADAFEACYLILSCPYFTYSERQSVVRPKKYYPIDNGLREAIITRSGKDEGKRFEIFIFLALKRKFKNVYYWKGKKEMDFVVETETGIRPLQVTLHEKKDRHADGAKEFQIAHPKSLQCLLVTMENWEKILEDL